MNQQEIEKQFRRLEKLLPENPLMKEDRTTRIASPDEFMLMQTEHNGSRAAFKHRDTRNYVYVQLMGGVDVLQVPVTPQAFHRGTFDTFE